MSDSGAPASTSAAETASVRGVAFGCANVAVSMTMPAISAAARPPPVGVERHAEARREQGDHLAGRRGVGVDPVGRAGRVVRGVVVDDRPAAAARTGPGGAPRPRRPARASRSRRARAGRTRRRGSGSVRNRSMPGRKAYSGGAGSVHTASPGHRGPPPGATTPRTAPSVSASGFSWLTASTRRAPTQTRSDDGVRARRPGTAVRSTVIAVACAAACDGALRDAVGSMPGPARPGTCADRLADRGRRLDLGSPSWGSRGTGVGSDSSIGAISSGSTPASSSASRCRTRVPRSAVSSRWTWRSGIRLIRSRFARARAG